MHYLCYAVKASICIWGSRRILTKSFLKCVLWELPKLHWGGPRAVGHVPTLSPVSWLCDWCLWFGLTRWQRWYLGEQWAARRVQAICSEFPVTAWRSNAGRDANHRAAFFFFNFFGLSDLQYLLSYNFAHPIEGRTIYPCDPASYRHLWIRGD